MGKLEKKRLSYSKIIVAIVALLVLAQQSLAATVGHFASAISAGMFESGNYTFQDSVKGKNLNNLKCFSLNEIRK